MQVSNLRQGLPAPADKEALATTRPVSAPKARQPDGPAIVADAEGRKLQLREPLSLLQEQNLLVAMGAHADSPRALQRALLAARVAAIDSGDGVPDGLPIPTNFRQYQAMLGRVGTAGLVAVVTHIAPAPQGEPVAIFEGDVGEYRLMAHEGAVGLWRMEDDEEPAADAEVAVAKN